jgi:hypothetical protein
MSTALCCCFLPDDGGQQPKHVAVVYVYTLCVVHVQVLGFLTIRWQDFEQNKSNAKIF